LSDEVEDALEAAGLLVFAADTFGYFPHPDCRSRIEAMDDLDYAEKEFIFSYICANWNESIGWLISIEEDGIKRATTAYAKLAKQKGFTLDQPDQDLSTVEEHGGHMWVILRNAGGGELARYVVLQTSPAQAKYEDPGTWWRLRYVEPKQEKAA
jgi:hypothetical protein